MGLTDIRRVGCITVRRDYRTTVVDGLTIEDLRSDWRTSPLQIEDVFLEVTDYLKGCEGGYHDLVTSNISLVYVWSFPEIRGSKLLRTVTTPLPPQHQRTPFNLACWLVYMAGYYEARHEVPWYRRPTGRHRFGDAGWARLLAFGRQFPDSYEWKRHVQKYGT